MADSIPFLSQAKSFVQFVCGDVEGAKKTQDNFSKQCPVVSQVRSAVEALGGDQDAALKTQKEFLYSAGGLIDNMPGLGHVKGVVHYAVGDKDGGDTAMKSASRPIGVMAGGVAGMVVGGPVGAVAGGVYGGVAMDSLSYTIDSEINGEGKKSGLLLKIDELKKNPNDPGKWFDTVVSLAGDAATGYEAGKAYVEDPKKTNTTEVEKEKQKDPKQKQKDPKQKQKDPKQKQKDPNQKQKDPIQKQDNAKGKPKVSESEQNNPVRRHDNAKKKQKDSNHELNNPIQKQDNAKDKPKVSESEKNNVFRKQDNKMEEHDCSKNKQGNSLKCKDFLDNICEDNASPKIVSNPDFQANNTCKISYEISEEFEITADEVQYKRRDTFSLCIDPEQKTPIENL